MFNNDENSLLSFIFYTFYHSIKAIHSLFIFYCVSNTLVPNETKRILIDLSWYAMELYTITEMNIKQSASQVKKNMIEKYPFLSLLNKRRNQPTTLYLNNVGDIIDTTTNDANNIVYVVTKDKNSNYYSVIDYSLDHKDSPRSNNEVEYTSDKKTVNNDDDNKPNNDDKKTVNNNHNNTANNDDKKTANNDDDNKFSDDDNKVADATNPTNPTNTIKHDLFDNKKLKYTLLMCTIEDYSNVESYKWFIKLHTRRDPTYNFYVNGNILLTKQFLLYFTNNHYNDTNKKELIDVIKKGTYKINILDNQAKPISWIGENKAIELHKNGPVVIELENKEDIVQKKPRISIDEDIDISILDGIQ